MIFWHYICIGLCSFTDPDGNVLFFNTRTMILDYVLVRHTMSNLIIKLNQRIRWCVQLLAPLKEAQLYEKEVLDRLSSTLINEVSSSLCGSSSRDQVIENNDLLTRLDSCFRDLKKVLPKNSPLRASWSINKQHISLQIHIPSGRRHVLLGEGASLPFGPEQRQHLIDWPSKDLKEILSNRVLYEIHGRIHK